ncbi:MAG TPA: penicillin-binding protein 1A [Gammaproteobacteria bacterium]|nr:penicillin-binding protein 1A [Gammaproteobacteria bacterium]
MKAYLQIPLVILAAAAALALGAAALLIGGYYYVAPSVPSAEELRDVRLQIPLRVYTRDGRLIAQFGEQRRTPVPYEEIPALLVQAMLAAEDDRFFEHPGFDYQGIIRAAINVLRTGGGRGQGGSTITQQLARDHFLSRERTYVRKFKEAILAVRMEREFNKEEILELFLNSTFFGQSSYGVLAAAQTYFGKSLDQLTVSDAAIIAGIPQGPSRLNPVSNAEAAKARRSYVLRRMRELNVITEPEYLEALAEPVVAKRYGPQTQVDAPYVAEMVRAEMIRRFGPAAYTAGLKVTTTVDSRLQTAANNAIRQTLIDYDERHGYRGPLAHVELTDVEASTEGVEAEQRWRELIADYADLLGYETGLVLSVDDTSATVYFRARGRQAIGLPAVEWAEPFISDEATGAKPTTVAQVLQAGDIVRFGPDADGKLRLRQIPEVQGAFVSVDPQDGAIAALTGGFDFFLSNYNRATQSKRQPGSAFKPFVYSAALENGFHPASIINDSPPILRFDETLEREWKPENFGGIYYGQTRLRMALAESMNAASIRVMQQVGVTRTVNHVRRFGFDDVAVPRNLSLALGAGGIAPVDLANAFATFANGGFRLQHHFIDRVEDANGDVLYQAMPAFACGDCDVETPTDGAAFELQALSCGRIHTEAVGEKAPAPQLIEDIVGIYPPMRRAPRAISPQNAYLITDILQDVIRRGTGAAARRALGRDDLAGKTGTTNDGRDTWFVGFNADVVAAAWVGFDQDRPLGGNEQGGVTAIPMWIRYMAEALDSLPEHEVERPPGIIEMRINPESGLIASDANRNSIFEKFEIDNIPEREPDPVFSDRFDPLRPDEQVTPGEPIFW